MRIEELNIFPIKSARGHRSQALNVQNQGPEGDRQWMLVDKDWKVLHAAQYPKISTIEVFYDRSALTVAFEKMFFKIPTQSTFSRQIKVMIGSEVVEASLEPNLYSDAISQYLGTPVSLVRYAPYSQRRVRSHSMDWKPEVRFARSKPLYLVNKDSLRDLNTRLKSEAAITDFRANIVIEAGAPYIEDQWKRIKIGDVILSMPKACAVDEEICIDSQLGQMRTSEVLSVLGSYRKGLKDINFGVLWTPENAGVIKTTDRIEILE